MRLNVRQNGELPFQQDLRKLCVKFKSFFFRFFSVLQLFFFRKFNRPFFCFLAQMLGFTV